MSAAVDHTVNFTSQEIYSERNKYGTSHRPITDGKNSVHYFNLKFVLSHHLLVVTEKNR